ncbi:hypothetical protein NUW54_g11930 [Trametes sanguinea]|uniref:Uncharacterized protein n=1 Tax=Trametes sanguinea TaxID=158606 RepID=A0ACC1N517_9APHY|nr:hypothetical protein NUW54_g11930 [Trametes sanguinea]
MAPPTNREEALARLRQTIRPGLTIGKLLVEVSYFSVLLYAGLYKSNPLTQPVRSGYVAISQIPIVVALGTKNNVVGMMIGFGYERLNYLHRFAGRLLVLAVNVHAIGYFYSWCIAGTFASHFAKTDIKWAFVALIAVDILALLSTDMFRQKFYNAIFIPSHVISVIILLVAVCFHTATASRVAIARLRPLPDLGMTRVEIPSINSGWRAGQLPHFGRMAARWGGAYELADLGRVGQGDQLRDDARDGGVRRRCLGRRVGICSRRLGVEWAYHEEAPLSADLEGPETPGLGEVGLEVVVLVRDGAEALWQDVSQQRHGSQLAKRTSSRVCGGLQPST